MIDVGGLPKEVTQALHASEEAQNTISPVASPADWSVVYIKGIVNGNAFQDGGQVQVAREVAVRLGLDYHVINKAISWLAPIRPWEMAVTIRNMDTGKPVAAIYDTVDGLLIAPPVPPPEWPTKTKMDVNIGAIAVPTNYRIKLWANQDADARLSESDY